MAQAHRALLEQVDRHVQLVELLVVSQHGDQHQVGTTEKLVALLPIDYALPFAFLRQLDSLVDARAGYRRRWHCAGW